MMMRGESDVIIGFLRSVAEREKRKLFGVAFWIFLDVEKTK